MTALFQAHSCRQVERRRAPELIAADRFNHGFPQTGRLAVELGIEATDLLLEICLVAT